MGLENLSSVFAEGVGVNHSQIEGRHSSELQPELHWSNHSLLDFDTMGDNKVDYQNIAKGGFTYVPPQPFPDGFTLNFNKSGYSFGDSELGNSKFINITSQNYGTLNYNGLKAFNFSPLSIGNSRYEQYISETPGAPTNVADYGVDGFNKTYDDINYNTTYTGTKYDDQQTIYFSDQYGSKTFNVDRPDPLFSSVNLPLSYGLQNLDTSYDDEQIIGASTSPLAHHWFTHDRTFNVDKPNPELTLDNPPKSTSLEYGKEIDKSTQFDMLYEKHHVAKDFKKHGGDLYLNKESDMLVSKWGAWGSRGAEPYIVTDIDNDRVSGRDFPVMRSLTDVKRILKFMSSPKGIEFIVKQNFLGLNSKVVYTEENNKDVLEKKAGNQRFKNLYNPLSTMGSLVRILGGQVPNLGIGFLLDREDPSTSSTYSDVVNSSGPGSQENEFSKPAGSGLTGFSNLLNSTILGNAPKDLEKVGDKMTLKDMIVGTKLQVGADNLTPEIVSNEIVNSEKAGLPFYFRDLRDNTYTFFRAYLESITENISPSWSPENYIGRSEPTYIYERAERDISFTLKLFATTKGELEMIYKKLNKLTSMCYPEYISDDKFDNKIRMKPPLVKFRMGDLYGSENQEMTGFIKSISNSIPDNSPWETRVGKKVPKFIMLSIGFQVIHNKVPRLKSKFYGILNEQRV